VIRGLKNLPRAEPVQERSDAPLAGKLYVIRSVLSRKALSTEQGSGESGSRVVQDASSTSRIVWKLERHGDAYRIVNTGKGLVLDAAGSGPVAQRTPNGSPGQFWSFVKAGDAYHIRCKETGRVLDVSGGSTDDGAVIILWDLKQPASPNQLWMLSEVTQRPPK
jgi:hypothetical protein